MDAPRSWKWQSVPVRLDQALVEAGLARSRTLATRLVREGRVTVNRVVVTKPAMKVSTADVLVAERIGLRIQDHVLDLALARLRG